MSRFKVIDLLENVVSGEWGQEPTGSDDVKVIRTINFLNDGRLDLNKEIAFRNIEIQKVIEKKLNYGDIIIEKSGGSPEQPVGRVVYFDIKNDIYLCNNFTSILRPDSNKIVNKYLFYYLFYRYRTKAVLKYQNKTTGIINLKLDDYLKNLSIDLPSKEAQLKFVSTLDKTQELIDKRKAQIEALDQLTQSVFLEMFGDPVQNSLGFKTEPLHELCVHIFGGGTPSKSNPEYYIGNIPWVTPKDMKDIVINDSIDHINEDAIANSSAKLIPPNSLLMVIRSGILKKKLPIAINTREVTVNQDMKAFVVDKNKITVEYLLYFFEFYQKVLLNRVRSVTADNLDFQQIKEILVPVPAINKQKEFSNIFYKVLAEKNKCLQQLNELENNFNSLMQRAFKGELFSD
ncbi:restriction endonuclease subunit S [Aneurinibacillus thermoaerophilus]|uniref:restriction endonuclease subunit S n=1 Tax=Aneurinibacillus thermoaerophilus TaxID=143495 RepID=UPI002E1F18B5|nr:restriction endonuclease subunit S [Aneurinibacillus thermoaerophilus]MED0677330.1 restriction endonuclease subunit S [Aneurinibacillus thermoaerophilus]MED0757896.1 restriction endonuclease subunit S [Aneurinibacillus thermoaerophilus]MED0762583.1 restriction endonuclease subunit S [Aneurinibacillus thermoaerophilus]